LHAYFILFSLSHVVHAIKWWWWR